MKKISLLLLAALFSLGVIKAQTEMDAYKFSKNDLTGTARSVSMGGAFGALGGDISGVAINPAGIGVYKSSEIVTTLNFQNTGIQTELNTGKLDEKKFKFNFDNLAFVTIFNLDNDVAPSLNIGFSYNRLKNFDRKYSMRGNNLKRSLTDYMSDRAGKTPSGDLTWTNEDTMWDVWDKRDWLSVLGYNSYLINETSNGYISSMDGLPVSNALYVEEKGSVSTYDFNIGTTFSDIVSIGATLSMTDINYRLYSSYAESFRVDGVSAYGSNNRYDLKNWSKTDGNGWQVKAGVIIKPVQELRIGIAYHSPTWYNMTDHFAANLEHNVSGAGSSSLDSKYIPGVVKSYNGLEDGVFDYQLRTPDKWVLSLAGVIGTKAIISADYELTNYNHMKLFDVNGETLTNNPNLEPNGLIKQDFKAASSARVGVEYRFTDQFSGRLGYAWAQNPMKNEVKEQGYEVTTDARAVTQYIFDGDTNYFTYGLGYRFNRNFYSDIAFVMKYQKSELHAFTGAETATLKDNTFQGVLTLGYKF